MYQAIKPLHEGAKLLKLGHDDLYVVTDVPQLQYELEVCRYLHTYFTLSSLIPIDEISML